MMILGAVGLAAVLLLVVVAHLQASLRLDHVAVWSQKQVEEAIRVNLPKDESITPVSGRPRLIIDVTSSMAGFVPNSGQNTEPPFVKVLRNLSTALDHREIFSFGTAADGGNGESPLEALLTPHVGLDAFFKRRESYHGSFNRDASLFERMAVGGDRPMLLVTDGVYSSPKGNGVEAVAQALDSLIEKGWYLGLFLFEAPFTCMGNDRCFYSEARRQAGMKREEQWLQLPCEGLSRPFYALSLDRSPDLVVKLDQRLSDALGPEIYRGSYQLGPSLDTLLARVPRIDTDRAADTSNDHWLMFQRPLQEPLSLTGTYQIEPFAVVDTLEWRLTLEQLPWRSSSGWQTIDRSQPEVVSKAPVALPVTASTRNLWRDFYRERDEDTTLYRLRKLIRSKKLTDALAATPELEETFRELKQWGKRKPRPRVLCTIVNPSGDHIESRDADIVRTLYALEAGRDGRFDEAAILESEIVGQRFRDVLGALSDTTDRLAASGRSITVSTAAPSSARIARGNVRPQGSFAINLDPQLLSQTDHFALYRLRFVPVSARLSETLLHRSTDDDGDPIEVLRTYRLSDWLTMLVNQRLERIAEDPRLQFFVTHPGRNAIN